MGYKNNDRCLDKAADDEPIFVFRAQDLSAPAFVRMWCIANKSTLTPEHYEEAMQHADIMKKWAEEHSDKAKFPD